MNKIFKIVWNAARGKMMVVNEATSSVQTGKKAAVTVAVVGALASGVACAATELTNMTSVPVAADEYYLTGDVELKSAEQTMVAGSTLDLQGHSLTLQSSDSSISLTNAGVFKNSTITNGGDVKLETGDCVLGQGVTSITANNIDATSRLTYAVYLEKSSDKVTLNANNSGVIDAEDKENHTISIRGNNGGAAIHMDVGAEATMQNFNYLKLESVSGSDVAAAINNAGGTLTIQNGGLVEITADKRGALLSRQSADALTDINAKKIAISLTNSTESDAYKASAVGLQKGTVSLTADEIDITAVGSETQKAVYGVTALAGTTFEAKGDLNITAIGGQSSYAVKALNGGLVTLGASGKNVNLTGDVDVDAESTLNLYGDVTLNGKTTIAGTLGGEGQVLLGQEDAVVTVTGATVEEGLQFGTTGSVTDALGGDASALKDNFIGFDEDLSIVMQEGDVIGQTTATLTQNGTITGVTQAVNKKTEALAEQVTLAPQMIQRIMMNDVRKRMGDLRAAEGTHGVWARYNGGQMSGQGMDADFNMVQVGIDTVPVVDAPRFGVAFSYAQTEADDTNGLATTDMDSFSLAFYGTKMYDNGMFVDVIGRMATMDTEMTVQGNKAEMDNVALSLSGELGWRFDVTDQFFIEPSAELTYTYTNADTFKMGRGEYELESVDSLVGRAGFAAGFKCPANKGDVYVRAAVVHEFMGDSTMNSMINGRAATPVESDGEDTYFEYAVGAQFNVNKNTYVYADVERTEGANVDEDWRANVGVRFAF